MLSFPAKLILTGTTFAPFFVALSIREFENGNSPLIVLMFLLIAIIFVFVCWLMLIYTTNTVEKHLIQFSDYTIERREHEGLVFLLVYLLPIIRSESNPFTSEPLTTVFCLIVDTVAISYSHAFHYNPVMRLFRYRFYTLKNKNDLPILLISKLELPSQNKELVVVGIGNDVIIECGER